MHHISEILMAPANPDGRAPRPSPWRQAAAAAHAIAQARTDDPATLHQLRRVCQLLTSHAVRKRERQRALLLLIQGCTKAQASAILDYLIPAVQARKVEEARALLGPLALNGACTPAAASAGAEVSAPSRGSERSA